MQYTREELRARHIERARERERGPLGSLVRWVRRSLARTEETIGQVAVACEFCGHVQPVAEAWRSLERGEWFCRDRAACWDRHRARREG
jgi:hypothetical protein